MKVGLFMGAALVAVAAPAAAESPFDGTWRIDVSSAQLTKKPWVRALKNGVYSCQCDTPLTVKADGQWHKVPNQAYADEMRVEVVDANTLKTESRKGGKLVNNTTETISADGLINNWENTDYSAADGKPVTASGKDKRVGAVPAASLHRINGGWITLTDGLKIDPAGLTMTLKAAPGGISRTLGTGESYTAKFGGPAVPVKGDLGKNMVKITKASATSFKEAWIRDGKVRTIFTYQLGADGKTINATSYNPIQKTTNKVTMTRL